MKQCIELVTVGKMGIKFNLYWIQYGSNLHGCSYNLFWRWLVCWLQKDSKFYKKIAKKKRKETKQTKKQPKQQENKLQSKTNRYTIRKKVKGK